MHALDTDLPHTDGESPPRIFVVDDSEALGEMIRILLADVGYEVEVFSCPLRALAAFEASAERPRLLISDYRMPGINGLELIHRCKLIHPHLKVIAASANILDEELGKYPVQPDRVLPKPYTTTSLLAAVRSVLAE
jgi:two-component system chemotaxis response regulator CheY